MLNMKQFTKNAITAFINLGKGAASITMGFDEATTKAEAYQVRIADTIQQTLGLVAGDVVPFDVAQKIRENLKNGWMQAMVDATGVSAEIHDKQDSGFRSLYSRAQRILAERKITFGKAQTADAQRVSANRKRAEKIGDKLLEQASNTGVDPYAIAGAYAADSENGVTQAQAAALVESAIKRKAKQEKDALIALRKQAQELVKTATQDQLEKVVALF
jgi:hypothetical protein